MSSGFAETVIKGNKSDTIMGAKVDLLRQQQVRAGQG